MDRYVTHATFSLEHNYPVRVFAAWAEPAAKARWFAPGQELAADGCTATCHPRCSGSR